MSYDGNDSKDPLMTDSTSGDLDFEMQTLEKQQTPAIDMKYFWIANAILVVGVASILIWCCCNRWKDAISEWTHVTGRNTDYLYAARVARRQEEEKERNQESPEERKLRLMKCFADNGVVMEINKDSFLENELTDVEKGASFDSADVVDTVDNNNDLDSVASGAQAVIIPTGVINGNRVIPNCCAVCLCSYDVGDKLVWSSNLNCSHAFHEECIVDWLIKMQEGTPCPCCRQEFTNLPDRSKKVDSTKAFDLHTISL
uniref:RING-type domain-containing protein n=1 Tax=Ditylum brightwellii TaxID=49249 RepID=A0A6V2DJT5_9STRA|mmetsp:Transcript_9713/g.13044  ORF Transcript_9713/g.13044 Transcript_9713/m.13044 type:complete len:257 (-) Transcript_9713:676-1446(-)